MSSIWCSRLAGDGPGLEAGLRSWRAGLLPREKSWDVWRCLRSTKVIEVGSRTSHTSNHASRSSDSRFQGALRCKCFSCFYVSMERMGCLDRAKRTAARMGVHATCCWRAAALVNFVKGVLQRSFLMFHRSKGIAEWRCVETLPCPKNAADAFWSKDDRGANVAI